MSKKKAKPEVAKVEAPKEPVEVVATFVNPEVDYKLPLKDILSELKEKHKENRTREVAEALKDLEFAIYKAISVIVFIEHATFKKK